MTGPEFAAIQTKLVPLLVPVLRQLRAANNDARAVMKANFAAAVFQPVGSYVRLGFFNNIGVDCSGLLGEEFGALVDTAMLQL